MVRIAEVAVDSCSMFSQKIVMIMEEEVVVALVSEQPDTSSES